MTPTINIAGEYSKTPGPRYVREGAFSGEEFRDKILAPKFKQAVADGHKLRIILDGAYGYPTSFTEEAFGGLQRQNPRIDVLLYLNFVSDNNPMLITEIASYIEDEQARLSTVRR